MLSTKITVVLILFVICDTGSFSRLREKMARTLEAEGKESLIKV